MNTDLYGKMLKEKGDIVIVAVGGNDITPTSQPKEIVRRITEIVNDISRNGCEHVYITEILTRGNFSKCPGLQKIVFDRQRIKINKCLAKTFKNNFLILNSLPTMPKIWFIWRAVPRETTACASISVDYKDSYVVSNAKFHYNNVYVILVICIIIICIITCNKSWI
ncbi:hypothetical protein DPMN_160538 [Dreissena polymorpha]|uniref:Uncharacterized protein n=1 Tax=Dreissena polymorpha TaxID=45954 RepID=A0A9D4EKZ2_DREPO|nr:hypothetical protein DPMN_160538 [Dreissena polymorpha]